MTALGSDTVSVDGTAVGTFANKTVATGKAITITGLSLAGADPVEVSVPAYSGDPQVSFAGSSLVRVRIQLERSH